MHIAILTFDGFNELDSFIAFGMLSRFTLLGDTNWRVRIASPTARVTSMNGLTVDAHIDLHQASRADAVLIGSGKKTREIEVRSPSTIALLSLQRFARFQPVRRSMLTHAKPANCCGTPSCIALAQLGTANISTT